MANSPRYDGNSPITQNFILEAVDCFRSEVKLGKDTLLNLIYAAQRVFESQPSLIEISLEKDEKITVCGDIHGTSITNSCSTFAK